MQRVLPWLTIIRAIRARDMQVTMTSRGRGLDEARIAAAQEAGLMAVSISLDGDEEAHDRLRGVKGSYAAAVSAMRILKARGLRVSCNTQSIA